MSNAPSDRQPAPTRRTLLAGASVIAAAATTTPVFGQEASSEIAKDAFKGQSVLITGTSSGFGKLTALYLARHGATVIASMRNLNGGARPEARDLLTIAGNENLDLHVVEIDVLDDEIILSGVAEAERIADGALDVVINNAGIGIAGPVEIADAQATDLIFQTNLFGYQKVARAALPKMRAAGKGHIFNVSSQLGRILIPGLGMYCSTKFGVEAMFETMAYELAPFGVEVTIIQPGGYPTKIWENGIRYSNAILDRLSDERKEAYAAHIAMAEGFFTGNRETNPNDVAVAIAEIMAMPAGTRPLRRPVHPNTQASDAANAAMTQIQAQVLSGGAFANWHKAVTD